jgi:hypothetical protein
MMARIALRAVYLAVVATTACADTVPNAVQLGALYSQFESADIKADVSGMPANERAALVKVLQAAKYMDALFLRQVWSGNESLLLELVNDQSELGRARLAYFLLQKGPWDRQNQFKPFIPGVPAKPASGNFYPADAAKAEVNAWIESLPEAQRREAKFFYTTVRRDPLGHFMLVPYSVEYQGELQDVARLLREASVLTKQPTLKTFLEKRAAALLSNHYYDSEVAWMDLDASIEPTIGPYENYEDDWFNYKAAFEAFVCIRDEQETQKLARFGSALQDVENHLPFDPKYRNKKLGATAPIRVVNEIFASGDANSGIQTAAYNLPNDERVTSEKGSKRVMLKNVTQAKYDKVLLPIGAVALTQRAQKQVDFESFFTWILMHELMHGLGPHEITIDGRNTTARQEMKELFSAIEEAKADITGLWAMQYFVDKSLLPKRTQDTMYSTYLASAFRSIRFGIVEAHGRGQMMQLNYLIDQGAITITSDGRFEINEKHIRDAVRSLTQKLLTLEAHGDYAGAKDLLDRLAVIRPPVQKVLDQLKDVPIDIRPRFVTADELLSAVGGH